MQRLCKGGILAASAPCDDGTVVPLHLGLGPREGTDTWVACLPTPDSKASPAKEGHSFPGRLPTGCQFTRRMESLPQ